MGSRKRSSLAQQLEKDEEEKRVQLKAMNERELRRLTRQTRVMKETKLKDATVEKNTKVRDILVEENKDLNDNLTLMKSRRRCIIDGKQAQNIANLFAQGDDLDEKIAQEKNYLKDLESQIQKDTQNIQIIKKAKGDSTLFSSEYIQKKENERAERTLEAWNSKLAAEQNQLGIITQENEQMRTKLRRLLKEKGKFNELFEELMKKLTLGKRIMSDIVDQSKQEFQKRDEISRKIEALRSRNRADLAKRMEEMGDLEKRLYEDKKLAEFRHRVQNVREKLVGGLRSSHRDTLEQARLTKRLEKTNDYWDQLKTTTGLSTAGEIAKYIENEDSTLFSLFNFNCELRNEVEVMTQKTAALVHKMEDEQNLAEDRREQAIKSRNTMEKRLELIEQTCNDLNDHYDANARVFDRLLDKIKIIFDFMKCNSAVLKDLLGNNTEVTEFNYRLYLGIVESKVIDELEFLNWAFPPITNKIATTTSKTALKSTKSTTTIAAEKSIIDRKVITIGCWECEGNMRPKLFANFM